MRALLDLIARYIPWRCRTCRVVFVPVTAGNIHRTASGDCCVCAHLERTRAR